MRDGALAWYYLSSPILQTSPQPYRRERPTMPWHDSSRAMSKSAELASLQVTGPSLVGWDAATPVNETLDAAGNANPEERGFGVADPNAPARRAVR